MKSVSEYPAVDYAGVARHYDALRTITRPNLDKWIGEIIQLGCVRRESVVLEVDCGMGRFAIAFWEKTNARIVAIDASREMLETAKAKPCAGNPKNRKAFVHFTPLPVEAPMLT